LTIAPRPDSPPVIVSGGEDGTVWVLRQLADGTPLVPPLNLSKKVLGIAIHGNLTVVTAAGADIDVHEPAVRFPEHRPADGAVR
jgi:hypothetical protein